MSPELILVLSYIAFIWLVILHTFEEMSCGIMESKIGNIQMTKNKYLLGASLISTVNLGTLAMIVSGIKAGAYLGLFVTAFIGVFQAIVHTVGYLRENKTARSLGAGFYSSIPLAILGIIVFIQLILMIKHDG